MFLNNQSLIIKYFSIESESENTTERTYPPYLLEFQTRWKLTITSPNNPIIQRPQNIKQISQTSLSFYFTHPTFQKSRLRNFLQSIKWFADIEMHKS